MRVSLKTLGCRLNEAELETWAQRFHNAGDQIVQPDEAADLVILNSCAVTEEAVRKSRHQIRRIQRDNPAAKVVVSGCYATLSPDEAASLLGVDLVVDNRDKAQLVELTKAHFDFTPTAEPRHDSDQPALFSRGRQRAFIKVQDGCRYRCTFCIVTVARGEERSRSVDEIVDEINTLHCQGVQEAALTGVHLGGYGSDNGSNLYQLVATILQQTGIPRLRMGSLEPWDLPPHFFELFHNPRLMPHLHLPLQSGSDTVLRMMARRCKTTEFATLVEQARDAVPGINITTDIIVGFPGETEAMWQATLDYVERIGFGHIHIFSYSIRQGTKAATLPNQVAAATKKTRNSQMHQLTATMKQSRMEGLVGHQVEVLWEGQPQPDKEGGFQQCGYTPDFTRVMLRSEQAVDRCNQILLTRLDAVDRNGTFMLGQPVNS